ncbi:STAS domain-containing protein [Paenibacillus sp. TRM 82003]|nr:STAS domain-containing protein [Kineococcus sp. TRM81007]MCI2239315.1 STAS domain-containing protein [Kineococcus sp. TRM81007]MCI3924999.1 STAS domain-containing protein [Paenibacillus sp. TRM 82003]
MAIQVAARRAAPSAADDVVARRAARAAPPGGATVVEEDPGRLVRITGRLDVHSVPEVRTALHAAVDRGSGPLVVSVDGVVVADATGLGVLVGAHRRAQRAGREMVLRDVPPPALRLVRVTRLHRVLRVDDERVRAAGAPPQVQHAPAGLPAGGREAQNRRAETSSMPRRAS